MSSSKSPLSLPRSRLMLLFFLLLLLLSSLFLYIYYFLYTASSSSSLTFPSSSSTPSPSSSSSVRSYTPSSSSHSTLSNIRRSLAASSFSSPSSTPSSSSSSSSPSSSSLRVQPSVPSCKNTENGRRYVCDSVGNVCTHTQVKENGCCEWKEEARKEERKGEGEGEGEGAEAEEQRSERSTCSDCFMSLGCCSSFERCVSCCITSNENYEAAIRSSSSSSSDDIFDECVEKCRTSSRSLAHGNMYKHSNYKHCFNTQETKNEKPLTTAPSTSSSSSSTPSSSESSLVAASASLSLLGYSTLLVVAERGVNCNNACSKIYPENLLPFNSSSFPLSSSSSSPSFSSHPSRNMLISSSAYQLYLSTLSSDSPDTSYSTSFECYSPFISLINHCSLLSYYFPCESCSLNQGSDQPCFVSSLAPSPAFTPSVCLINKEEQLFDCEGHHEHTHRLCPCITKY